MLSSMEKWTCPQKLDFYGETGFYVNLDYSSQSSLLLKKTHIIWCSHYVSEYWPILSEALLWPLRIMEYLDEVNMGVDLSDSKKEI